LRDADEEEELEGTPLFRALFNDVSAKESGSKPPALSSAAPSPDFDLLFFDDEPPPIILPKDLNMLRCYT
jgi:hypothetical protein